MRKKLPQCSETGKGYYQTLGTLDLIGTRLVMRSTIRTHTVCINDEIARVQRCLHRHAHKRLFASKQGHSIVSNIIQVREKMTANSTKTTSLLTATASFSHCRHCTMLVCPGRLCSSSLRAKERGDVFASAQDKVANLVSLDERVDQERNDHVESTPLTATTRRT